MISIPLCREPSSIEKILGDAEMEQQQRQLYAATRGAQYQVTPARSATVTAAAAPASLARERGGEEKATAAVALPLPPPSPPPLIRRFDHDREQQQRLQQMQSRAETEWRQQPQRRQRTQPPDRARAAAVAIQSAFRGYMASFSFDFFIKFWAWLVLTADPAGRAQARRNNRSLRGLIRLQGVMRGASVRRQAAQAMRRMQTLVRVQAKVRASRVEAMERRNRQHHGAMIRDGGRWRTGSQDGGVWDGSLLPREEADARTRRKVEAIIKRERALAYAYSHQVIKSTQQFGMVPVVDRPPNKSEPMRGRCSAGAASRDSRRVRHIFAAH
jgi:hypothetical protein